MKQTRKSKAKSQGIKIKSKYIMMVLIAAIIGYLSYYLGFPNSYSTLIMLVFSIALLQNFNSRNGIGVLIYAIILTTLLLPLNLFVLSVTLTLKVVFLLINLLLVSLVLIGLKNLKRWGFYLAILVYLLSFINSLSVFFASLRGFVVTLPGCIAVCSILTSGIFIILSLIYLIKSRKYFENG